MTHRQQRSRERAARRRPALKRTAPLVQGGSSSVEDDCTAGLARHSPRHSATVAAFTHPMRTIGHSDSQHPLCHRRRKTRKQHLPTSHPPHRPPRATPRDHLRNAPLEALRALARPPIKGARRSDRPQPLHDLRCKRRFAVPVNVPALHRPLIGPRLRFWPWKANGR
jgi:hypothetical protein